MLGQPRYSSSLATVLAQHAPRMGKSSRKAALFEVETDPPKASWNWDAIESSGVPVAVLSGRPAHLLSRTRRACFSGYGSRKADLAANRSLRRGIQSSSTFLAVRARGGVQTRGSSSGSFSESMKEATKVAVRAAGYTTGTSTTGGSGAEVSPP